MSLLITLFLTSLACAQSSIPILYRDSVFTTNTCLRRSVYVYTSESSTYVVTDFGTTSLAASPTYCANASISTSTVYGLAQTITTALPASTVTIYQQQILPTTLASSEAQPTATILADSGFETGNENPFNTSSSGSGVSAAVVQSGPLLPFSGDSYLLITFDDPTSPASNVRRQANTPLTYNVTQQFAATAGTTYLLSAYAAQVGSGASEPSCSLTICADPGCGSPASLSSKYSQYSYISNAPVSESDAVATFSVTCDRSAYVALDNVTISSNSPGVDTGAGSSALTTSTVFITRTATLTLQQSQTFTEIETTTVVRGSTLILTSTVPTVLYQTATLQPSEPATRTFNHTATQTATVQVGNVETKTLNFTGTKTTTLWNTATAIQAIAETKFFNVTVSEHLTTTTTLFQTLNRTTTLYPNASLVYETITATTTQIFTETTISRLSQPAGTLTTTATLSLTTTAILSLTTTEPRETLPASTVITYLSGSIITLTLPRETESVPYTLPQATFTPLPETTYVTLTLEPSTITSYISVTLPAVTEYQTWTASALTETVQLTQTLPGETATFTLPPETFTLPAETATSILPPETFTLPAETATLTLPAETYTIPAETTSVYAPTITETYTPVIDFTSSTEVSSSEISSSSEEYIPSSTSEEPVFVPQPTDPDVPAVALASPTVIIGDIYGSPSRYDDVSLPVSLPFPITLYGRSSSNVRVSTNGVVGLTALNGEFSNRALPYYGYSNCQDGQVDNGAGGTVNDCFLETGALALWDGETQQGIYYEVTGTQPSRQVTFEFYLSHIQDPGQYYHYLIRFWEARWNIVSFQYLNVSDWGCSATVGVESQEAGLFQQYGNSQPTVYPGLQLTFDTGVSNSYVVDSPGDTSVPPQNCPGYNGGSEAIRQKKVAGVGARG
ncbi:hypothetical protein KC318_g1195 [Hortaea werneckii]|nr:hypothetical protein KC334_g974 [Hortaea werneckii]KAI7024023.1 hypothetical protein KC355_g1543 [Hortaea werneckii]KAI7200179.1 hypothetical protein KC324_g2855 [Hortaea werneckii]KAI7594556.1 hypothetical protein KC316_g1057 [Hortaea werneckii]KAI7675049.1 hypothetical protein KC318_g1195 [Hortaea werneckii]